VNRRGVRGDDCVELDLRVRYAETDRMGVVYYANYLVWFEMGRSEYCRQRGFHYLELEEQGYRLVVSEATCKYRQPARYDELVTVRTVLHALQRRAVCFRYQVVRKGPGETLVEGETKHLCIDAGGKVTTIPEPYFTHLARGLRSLNPSQNPHGIPPRKSHE
jgi:acyl-CoA thioester hydrolase